MSELAYLSVAQAGRLIRSRELSPVALTEALLERIAALDPIYHAFIAVTAEIARAAAKAAETEIAGGRWRGPMHGVPYALKDIFDVAGLPTTCHSKLRIGHRASADATVVRRLRDAGAVLLGKLSLHEFANGGPTLELPWPAARNPWNTDLHPGGSSSGCGTAAATGMAPATLGTDTGGSVRNPATCCGVIGMKPTYGAVSRAGVFPLAFSLDHVGPITRTVEDNAILFQAIAGHDPADPASAPHPHADCVAGIRQGVKGLKIGVIAHFYEEDQEADPEQVAAIEAAIAELGRLGAEVKPVRISPLARWMDCGRIIHYAEAYAIHERDLQERPQDYAAITRRRMLGGAFIAASEYVKAQQLRTVLCAEYRAVLRDVDALVTLSSYDLPCRIDDDAAIARTYERQCRMPFNVAGGPAISVPTGFSKDGIPLAMQIAGSAFDEATVYRIAHAYCDATGWTERHPPVAQAVRQPAMAK
ncbi:MAG TPA: amidase [Xanthobacteraceae bacterium]|jgi:aspartyl-tRNA(Asn)/glutamyl-tRNA(Gln) amidotransferase subunit A|nr:amidase [Xanthobacteraceae bacterium]